MRDDVVGLRSPANYILIKNYILLSQEYLHFTSQGPPLVQPEIELLHTWFCAIVTLRICCAKSVVACASGFRRNIWQCQR
jgi:hypothetical protein